MWSDAFSAAQYVGYLQEFQLAQEVRLHPVERERERWNEEAIKYGSDDKIAFNQFI